MSAGLLLGAAVHAAGQQLLSVQKIWDAAPHNAFTGLVRHNGQWYCCFREAAEHGVSLPGSARVLRSADGQTWTSAALMTTPAEDFRDPHLTITPDNRLMLYVASATPQPVNGVTHRNFAWFSADGTHWSERVEIGEPNIWLWRITWHQGVAYGIGYAWTNGTFIRLYRSADGVHFETLVPNMGVPVEPNETSQIVFMEDGRAYVLAREGAWGTAMPPYTQWTWTPIGFTVGGPEMVRLPDGRFIAGSRLSDGAARMSLSWVDPATGSLSECLTLPSGGDTSYPGMVCHEDLLWVSYYSSHEGKTSIYLAKVAFPEHPALSVRDTFSRPDADSLGSTESPVLVWSERSTLGQPVNVAAISEGQLLLHGSDGSGPAATGPGMATLDVNLPDLLISADMRFTLNNPSQKSGNNTGGFALRRPRADAHIAEPGSAGQITIQMHPGGGLYIGQKTPTGTTITTVYVDNPFVPGQQTLEQVNGLFGPGSLPAVINGRPFDADGDGVLESGEPFNLAAVLMGRSLQVLVNGQAIASATVAGVSSSPSNMVGLLKNRWTSNPAGAAAHVRFDNLRIDPVSGKDDCADAPLIVDGVINGSTLGFAPGGVPSCGPGPDGPDAWYRYIAPTHGDVLVSTCGSEFDTLVSVLTECGGADLACNDNCGDQPCAGGGSCLTVPVVQGQAYLIRVAGANGASGLFGLAIQTRLPLTLTHRDGNDPLTEAVPWSLDTNGGSPRVALSAGHDPRPYWGIAVEQGLRANYQYKLSPPHLSDPAGWTLTARVRTPASSGIFQSYIEVSDGRDAWSLNFVAPDGNPAPGLWTVDAAYQPHQHLAEVDPAAAYHTCQMVYDPQADEGRGAVSYYLDRRKLGTQTRAAAINQSLRRIVWGDNDSGGTRRSESHWTFLRFEVGQKPLPPCDAPFADADRDGDVDQEDFGRFQACYTGTGEDVVPACSCFDADGDQRIDRLDLDAFAKCAGGPGVPAEPDCGP